MGRCLIIAVLTVATFVIVTYALLVHLWAVALGLLVGFSCMVLAGKPWSRQLSAEKRLIK